jgi:arylsulfatase
MSQYEPGFTGKIANTYQESTPSWPELPKALGGPNVITIVFDDMGFAHPSCFGSEIPTPNIDSLAATGLRYTGFHTTALCSPSRASLLTGRNHHSVGMRGVSNWNTGFPNMRGGISPRAGTIAEVARTGVCNFLCRQVALGANGRVHRSRPSSQLAVAKRL